MKRLLAFLALSFFFSLGAAAHAADEEGLSDSRGKDTDIGRGNDDPGGRPFDDNRGPGNGSRNGFDDNDNRGRDGDFGNDRGGFGEDRGRGPEGDPGRGGGNPFPQQPEDTRIDPFPSPGGGAAPSPVFPDPSRAPAPEVGPGPSFPSPGNSFQPHTASPSAPMPSAPVEVFSPASVAPTSGSGFSQPTTYITAPRDSVYSQSSASVWTSGDPFNPAPPAANTAVASQPYQPSMVLMWTGRVISLDKGSVTIKDKNRSVKTFYVDSAWLTGVEKGSTVQVGAVPGQTRAESLHRLG